MIETEETSEIEVTKPAHDRKGLILIVGLAMLLIGFASGYFGRGEFGPEAVAAKKTATMAANAVQTQAAANQEAMKLVIAETKHFKGDSTAPVTIIEFSDFQ